MADKKYVDGFVLVVPTANLAAYKKIAAKAGKVWMEHGALEYYETVADDMNCPFGIPFPKLTKAKPGETVLFSWIAYRSRAHRDKVNAKVMADPRMNKMMTGEPPFDCKRIAYGGFKAIVAK